MKYGAGSGMGRLEKARKAAKGKPKKNKRRRKIILINHED